MFLDKVKNYVKNPQVLKKSMFLRELFLKMKLPMDFPYILNIEPTNACNLNCMMCPREKSKRKVGFISIDLYKKIIDECANHKKLFRLFLQKDGEPLLHPDIVEMVRYAKEKKVAKHVSIITNGVALKEELAEGLIKAGLDEIIFSIDTTDPQKYIKIKGKDHLEKVEKNIENLIKIRSSLKAKNPYIHARIINMNLSEEELTSFRNRWAIADDIDLIPFHTWHSAIEGELTYKKNGKDIKRYPCSLLWYTGVINWDGEFSLCCIDYNSDGIVGDVNNQTVHEIWNGEEMRKIRKYHIDGEYDKIKICSKCEYWLIKEDIGDFLREKQIL